VGNDASAGSGVVARAEANNLRLKRESPDGWFSLLVPTAMGDVMRHADVDGGFYLADDLEITYDYWTYGNTPNFLRDANGNYSKRPLFPCSKKAKDTLRSRTRIGGRRALIQSCFDMNQQRGLHYVYHVTFLNLKVDNGQDMENGMFNLTINYKDLRYRRVAERIVRSLDFRPPPNNLLHRSAGQRASQPTLSGDA
jgi:hypothetical protein